MATTPRLIERVNICECITPVLLNTGNNTGDWVSLQHYTGVLCVVHKAVANTGQDIDITVLQATNVSGASSKAVSLAGGVYDKVGATTIPNGVWTRTNDSDDLGTYTNLVSGENEYIAAIDIQVDDLDVAGGFDCVQLNIDDPGTFVHFGLALYFLYGPRIAGSPDTGGSTPIRMPSPLVD